MYQFFFYNTKCLKNIIELQFVEFPQCFSYTSYILMNETFDENEFHREVTDAKFEI